MKKIYELLGLRQQKADLGIEIEMEGERLIPTKTALWHSEDDGSLRGMYPESRAEYVTAPILVTQVKDAMKELNTLLAKSVVNFSFRTSVHVHINVHQMTEQQLMNLIYTYILLEEPLMNFCGKERKGNRFCLRLQDAEGLMETITSFQANGLDGLGMLSEENIRYSAMNLAAVRKYGTVEFRGMRGTMDPAIIGTWTSALVQLRVFAMAQESLESIYKQFTELSSDEFVKLVLGEYAKAFVYPKMEKDLRRSFSLSIDIPFYAARVARQNVPKAPKKPVDKIEEAMKRYGGKIPIGAYDVNAEGMFIRRNGEVIPNPLEDRVIRFEMP